MTYPPRSLQAGRNEETMMRRTIAIGLMVPMVLAACGDDDDTAATTSSDDTEVTTATFTAAPTTSEVASTITTDSSATTEAPTTAAPTTTIDPEIARATEFFEALAKNTMRSLRKAQAMTEPGSGAYNYVSGLVATRRYDTAAVTDRGVTEEDGTFTVRWDDMSIEFSDLVSTNGRIADFKRKGEPVSQTVVPSGQEILFEGGVMTVVDLRLWEGNVGISYMIRNDSAEIVAGIDAYVANGRQWSPDYAVSTFPNPRPGATVAGWTVFTDAPRGGEATVYLPNADSNAVIQVPA